MTKQQQPLNQEQQDTVRADNTNQFDPPPKLDAEQRKKAQEQLQALHEQVNKPLKMNIPDSFGEWLSNQANCSIGFCTDRQSRFVLLGTNQDKKVTVVERNMDGSSSLLVNEPNIFLATTYQIWNFQNAMNEVEANDTNEFDSLYIPRKSYVTGNISTTDIHQLENGALVFVNPLFSCLAGVSDTHSFVPLWKPTFVSKLVAENRCFLSGLASNQGKLSYVTAFSTSDENQGWKENLNQGVVIDLASNENISTELSLPQSPRFYQNKLWLLNSGTGEFGYINLSNGAFEVVTFLPGYLKGLSFIGDYAVIGSSLIQKDDIFSNLEIFNKFSDNSQQVNGLFVVNLKTGVVETQLSINETPCFVTDVATLQHSKAPMALGFFGNDIKRAITIAPPPQVEANAKEEVAQA